MGSNALFIQLAIVLGLSAGLGYLMKCLKLPLIVAYLLAGVFLSALRIFDPQNSQALTFLPDIGVAFVLFLIGMELDLKELKNLGKPVLITGLGQIILSLMAGFIISTALGFSPVKSFYLGVGLSFSSTIVVVKLLLEKKDLSSLYGKLSLGILLLEDLVAIILLMMMTVGGSVLNMGLQSSFPIPALFLKALLLLFLAYILSRFVLGKVFSAIAKSSELLFLTALSWCFIFVAISLLLGFSVVIGAFLAGVALANSPFHFEIQGKVKPLRDFFITLFFVYLGSQVSLFHLGQALPVVLIFTVYALVAKPLIFLLFLGAQGFKKHTIFQTALNLSQISEFSLIVMVIGLRLHLVTEVELTAMALVGVLSTTISSIMITSSRHIYHLLSPVIGWFVHSKFVHQMEGKSSEITLQDHAIVVGGHLMGGEIVRFLKKEKVPFIIIDFNPKVIQNMVNQNLPALFGDIGDPEILDFLNLEKARIVVSTAPSLEDNLLLLSEVKRRNKEALVFTRAASANEAEMLYQAGSDYVIMPELVSGVFIAQILNLHWPNIDFFKKRSETELHKLAENHFALE